jgi:hypothetical protein
MISDILRFFKIGFLFKNEFDLEIRLLLAGELADDGIRKALSVAVCNGPYNQVTSQSFNLYTVRRLIGYKRLLRSIAGHETYQFSVSGDTVFNLFFDFVHVRHEAFSNLALLLYAFRFDTISFHDDQISSSFQLCDK